MKLFEKKCKQLTKKYFVFGFIVKDKNLMLCRANCTFFLNLIRLREKVTQPQFFDGMFVGMACY